MADPLVVLRSGTSAQVVAKVIDALVEQYPAAYARGAESVEIRGVNDERYLLLQPIVIEVGTAPVWNDS